jgi:ketosteroid isomerase-like protein
MSNKKPVHVTPRGREGWAVVRDGNERASSVHPTQAEAAKAGRQAAQRDHTEFYLHGRDGQIRERDSYGHDPYPPRG